MNEILKQNTHDCSYMKNYSDNILSFYFTLYENPHTPFTFVHSSFLFVVTINLTVIDFNDILCIVTQMIVDISILLKIFIGLNVMITLL